MAPHDHHLNKTQIEIFEKFGTAFRRREKDNIKFLVVVFEQSLNSERREETEHEWKIRPFF